MFWYCLNTSLRAQKSPVYKTLISEEKSHKRSDESTMAYSAASVTTEDYDSESTSEREDTEQISEVESDRDEVILSLYWRSGKLGAAVYSLQNPVVYVLNDVEDDFLLGFKTLKSLIYEVQPTQVVTCKSMPQKFIFLLNHLLGRHKYGDDQIPEEHANHSELVGNLHLLPDAEFRHQNSLRQVFNMRLPEEPQNWQEEEHKQYIRSIIDPKKESMVNALARLLKYLNTNLTWLCLGHDQNPILAIRALSLEERVWVNSEAFETLAVFSQDPHPSLFKWIHGASKEGLSVFGLFNRCQSKLGSKFMRSALLQPVSNHKELNERHEVISFCINAGNEDVVSKMRSCIGKVQSITGILPRLFAAQASVLQWKTLRKTNHNILLLREICIQCAASVTLFKKARTIISEELYRIDHLMERIIDFETSERMKRFVVLPGIDDELDEMKQIQANLPNIMEKTAGLELPELPEHINECSIDYIPEIGFLISIPIWKDDLTEEDMRIPGFKFKFIANKTIHYKSPRCRELDSSLGDISLRIRELELKIMVRLIQYIQQYINTLVDSLSFVGRLDCLIAFADVAKEFGYVKPTLTANREILIYQGRHPLQEHCVSNFVPNDTYSDKDHGFAKLLTGPNASGKSVYLKQVAIIALLAHTGSYVPASKAVIGIIDQIHTIIQTRECAASQMSAFMMDMKQISIAMTMSTKSSLVVIDEFGKGTLEVDGLSILAAFIRDLIQQGLDKCPHFLLSTHFHRLINLLDNDSFITAHVLDHLESDGEIVYLYHLKKGQINSSLALDVARARAFSEKNKTRAKEILASLEKGGQCRPVHLHKKMILSKENKSFTEWFLADSSKDDDPKGFKEKLKSCRE